MKLELSEAAQAALARFRAEIQAVKRAPDEHAQRRHRQEARSAGFELAHEISRLEREQHPPAPPPERKHAVNCRCTRCLTGQAG